MANKIIGNTEYKAIRDKAYINGTQENVMQLAAELDKAGINYSGRVSEYRSAITVEAADRAKALEIMNRILNAVKEKAPAENTEKNIIGNTEYRYIANKRYVKGETEIMLRIADRLAAENISFSGRINGETATVTVSGDETQELVKKYFAEEKNRIENIQSAYFLELSSDTFEDGYYISEINTATGEEIAPYRSSIGDIPMFLSVEEALKSAESEGIALSNSAEQLDSWRNIEAEKERQSILARSRELIRQLPETVKGFDEYFVLRENAADWVYFNPDGADGEGEFIATTLYAEDLVNAYNARSSTADYEKQGQDAFISVIENGKQTVIGADTKEFERYALSCINSRNKENVIVSAPVVSGNGYDENFENIIERLENNFEEVKEHKNRVLSDSYVDITDRLAEKQNEITAFITNEDFTAAAAALSELEELLGEAEKIKTEIQSREITLDDVNALRSIQPARKSVQNMLENEVAKTPKFEKLLGDEMGAKSAFEMRNSGNEWRDDESKTAVVVNVQKRNLPDRVADIKKITDIPTGEFVNKDTDMAIQFSKRSIREIIAKAMPDAKRNIPVEARMAALYQMKDLLENAVCFDSQISEANSASKSPNTLFIHRLYGMYTYDNKTYLANLAIEEFYNKKPEKEIDKTGNRLYSFRDINITPVEALELNLDAIPQKASTDTSADVIKITIPQLYEIVKTYDEYFFENPKAAGRLDREAEIEAQQEFSKAMEILAEREKSKNLEFTVITFEDSSEYVEAGQINDSNVKNTAAYADMMKNNFDINNIEDLDENIKVEYAVYRTGDGEAVMPTEEELDEIRNAVDNFKGNSVFVSSEKSSLFPWKNDDDISLGVIEKAREAAHNAGLPFREVIADPEEEFNPYAFDGTMSPEDHELMHKLMREDSFEIYQVKSGEEYHSKRFAGLSELSGAPNVSDYDLVYSGKLSEIDITVENKNEILENIFTKFNIDRPEDFKGHSLSVSDVVVLHRDDTDTAHYVDTLGFNDVPEFLKEKTVAIQKSAFDTAVELINEYTEREFGETAIFSNTDHVDLAYTTHGITELPIEVYADLDTFRIVTEYDGKLAEEKLFNSLDDMNAALANLDFNELVYVSDDVVDRLAGKDKNDSPVGTNEEQTAKFVTSLRDKYDPYHTTLFYEYKGYEYQVENYGAKQALGESLKEQHQEEQRRIDDMINNPSPILPPNNNVENAIKDFLSYADDKNPEEKFEKFSFFDSTPSRKSSDELGFYSSVSETPQSKKRNTAPTQTTSPVGNLSEQRRISAADIKIGDRFLLQNEEVTVSSLKGIYPDDISLTKIEFDKSNSKEREVIRNANKFDVANYGVYLGNSRAADYTITDKNYGTEGGAKARFANNVAAIKLLKTIEKENRTATPEEQEVLVKYTGWGAIPQAFDSVNDKWSSEYSELKGLLTPEEYAAARKSTMNAHYTSPTVISAIYEGLKNLGFEGGKILEPAMGIGNFFGAMPEELRKNSELTGVELDSITGRIAQQLYPNADVQIKGFEKTNFPDNSFDVSVGNVPFGDYKLNDRRYNERNFLIHDYFFAKALDKVHAGGIVAFVTSKGTLDKENDEVRKYIAQRAELLGAVRLPNNAFKDNAGTEVTSDIIFLQKRERPIEIDPDSIEWLKKGKTPDGSSVNNYFVDHPEMVLGKIVEGNKLYGNQTNETSCIPIDGADLKQQLAVAIKNISGEYRSTEKEIPLQNADEIPAPANSRKYSLYAVDGNLYFREAGDTMKKVNVSGDTLSRAVGLVYLRDRVRELLDMQLNNADGSLDNEIAECRRELNAAYDSFVGKYGNVSDKKNAKAMQGDDGYNIVSALEIKDENGQVTGKADIFSHNTVKPKIIVSHVDTAEEALILSVAEKAKVDFDFMTELCGMDKDKLISELSGQIYRLPQEEEKYVTADEYLTGNIRKKLRELDNAPEGMDISENKKALEEAMPTRVEAKDISVKLGAHWVAPEYIADFIKDKFSPDFKTRNNMEVQYSSVSGTWKIDSVTATGMNNYAASQVYGTKRMNAYQILEGILNNSSLQVKDRVKDEFGNDMRDENGKYILVLNDEETKAVRHCTNIIKSEFADWIFSDPERREALVQKYNEVYNSIRHREYDGSHLNFSGMNTDIQLKEHQKNAVARALYGGNALLAHAVGAGKSYEMIAIAMEGKRLGLHNKSLFAVPNALTEQMGNDFRKLYPNANILVATQKDFEKDNRQQLFGKIAANDWDAVIVGHSQFDRMGLSAQREREYLIAEVNKLRFELEMAASENQGKKSFTVKQIEKSIASYEDKLAKMNDAQKKDDFIDFEQLGFDKVFVDESHTYKNLATATKMHNVSGLGSQGSARAFNLLMKSKYLDELTGGRGLTFASGTPVSNSMTELYTLMRYLQADTLKDLGINHFDEWAADFGEVKTDYELKPESDGKYQLKTRFAKFTNLPELMGIFKEAADIRTADTLDLEKPKANVAEVVAEPSKIQKKAIKNLGKRAAEIRSGNVDPRNDNMLKVTSDGRKIGLDQRLLNPALPDDPNSKVNLCVKNVFDIYSKTAEKKSTQCIFCDLSTPKAESRQDRFVIYRPKGENEYETVRKRNGISKKTDFAAIKRSVDKKTQNEEDRLKNGDIAVIRRPTEDKTKIISEAAVFENGKFDTSRSDELLEKLELSPIMEMPPKEFNIYDDIKNKLVERGVPEKEVAFIHDYDTPEQKQGLFNKMNAGEVRILLGSTSKCGAGMNAQKKMIALHHLDAPMRPSDMEQRNGRIERQGNENTEVQIYRYVTDRTFDSYLYQMLENKQKFISQIMTSKTPERVCSDIDEAALDYAEVKALCAGNPLIKEEMELQTKIKDLKMEKSRYSEKIYDLQDNIKVKIPSEIQITELHIKHIKADLETARSQPKVINDEGKESYPIKIEDKVYSDRTSGGEALKAVIGANIGSLAEGKTIAVGEYRGLKLSVMYDTLSKNAKACLEGEKRHYCDLNIQTTSGNLIRLDNCINNIEKNIEELQEKTNTLKTELEQMKIDVQKPFSKSEELFKAETRLEEVHEELTKFELTDDTMNKEIFERLAESFPEIISGKCDAMKFEAGKCFDTLSVEMHGTELSIAHTYEQNGDLMYDPLICFEVDYDNEKVIPVSYENSGLGIYETYDTAAEATPASVQKMNSVLDFTDNWLDNIEEQGYRAVEAEEKEKDYSFER